MYKVLTLIVAMLILDYVWIKIFMGPLYQHYLGSWMQFSEGYRLGAGLIAVYGLMCVGLFAFVLKPGVDFLSASLFGCILYGVFALTNYVVFSNWAIELVIADVLWGSFLYGALWYIAQLIGYMN